jgi:hypothetical protein
MGDIGLFAFEIALGISGRETRTIYCHYFPIRLLGLMLSSVSLTSCPNSSRHGFAAYASANSAETGCQFIMYVPQGYELPCANCATRMTLHFAYHLYRYNRIVLIALGRCFSSLNCFLRASEESQIDAPLF